MRKRSPAPNPKYVLNVCIVYSLIATLAHDIHGFIVTKGETAAGPNCQTYTAVNGIDVHGEELDAHLAIIMDIESEKVCSTFAEGSFQHLFWKQQMEARSATTSQQRRCIHTHAGPISFPTETHVQILHTCMHSMCTCRSVSRAYLLCFQVPRAEQLTTHTLTYIHAGNTVTQIHSHVWMQLQGQSAVVCIGQLLADIDTNSLNTSCAHDASFLPLAQRPHASTNIQTCTGHST